jgi:hypothetical protein
MGQARDFPGLVHVSYPNDSFQGCCFEIDAQPPTRQVWALVGQ